MLCLSPIIFRWYHLGLLVVALLLFLLKPHLVSGNNPDIILPNNCPDVTSRYVSTAIQPLNIQHVPRATTIVSKTRNPVVRTSRGNCIETVRQAGYFVPRTLDGYARTVKIDSTELPPEGETVVIRTSHSSMGHVSVIENVDGKLVYVEDSVFPKGSEVDMSQYEGYLYPK